MNVLKENPDLFQPDAAIDCELPNTACTGRLGLCAFFSLFRGFGSFPFPSLVLPTRG
jgi:hypothetical protein